LEGLFSDLNFLEDLVAASFVDTMDLVADHVHPQISPALCSESHIVSTVMLEMELGIKFVVVIGKIHVAVIAYSSKLAVVRLQLHHVIV